ncbi:MAG: DUF2341 domain-containing protein [Candidatus Aenigmatarchaeota archaeon]
MYLISRWIEPTKIIDTSSVVLLEEPFIFNNIIEKAREIINTTKECSLLQLNLDEYKNFVESLTSEKGFLLNFTYSIRNCQNVELNITLASEKMTISSFVPITGLPSNWLSGFRFRRLITISNSGSALTDYQVLVNLDTASLISAGKMRSDCGDIRFTDSDGTTLLNYWLESGCNSASTKLWVKVPSIPASSTKTIYVYYGNPAATSASNLDLTFVYNIFFDGFESGSLTSNWTRVSTNQGRIQVTSANGPFVGFYHLTMDDTTGDTTYSLNKLTTNFTLKAYNVSITYYGKEWADENHNCPSSWTGNTNGDCLAISCDGSTWYKRRDLFLTSTYTQYSDLNNTYNLCGGIKNLRILWQQYDNYPITTDGIGLDNINITWFGVKYALIEPTVSIGPEESI